MVLFMLLELEYCFEKATVPLGKLPCCRRTFRIDSVKHIRVEETCGKWWDLSQSLVLCRRHFLPSTRVRLSKVWSLEGGQSGTLCTNSPLL